MLAAKEGELLTSLVILGVFVVLSGGVEKERDFTGRARWGGSGHSKSKSKLVVDFRIRDAARG